MDRPHRTLDDGVGRVRPGWVGRMIFGASEFAHERQVVDRIATIRLVLAFANFAVVLLDQSVTPTSDGSALKAVLAACASLLAYALLIKVLLNRTWISLERLQLASPLLDVVFAASLIVVTGGYLSPFNLWLVFAIVATASSRYRWMPMATTGLCMAVQGMIVQVQQEQPLPLAAFAVRISYIVGFAFVVTSVSALLTRQSRDLSRLEQFGRALGECVSLQEAGEIVCKSLGSWLPASSIRLELESGDAWGFGPPDSGPESLRQPLNPQGRSLGVLRIWCDRRLAAQESLLLRIACARLASALLRLTLAKQIVDAAAAEERLRLADELHNTYLQVLAAADMRAEAARILLASDSQAAEAELVVLKQLVRDGAKQARAFISSQQLGAPLKAQGICELVASCWAGQSACEIDPGVYLPDDSWRAVELFVREGLNNARRHGHSTRVSLSMRRAAACIELGLESDGEQPPADLRLGYGLTRLDAVFSALGGKVALEATPTGAVLVGSLPELHGMTGDSRA